MVRRIGTAIYCLRTGSTRRFKSVQAPKPNSKILRCGSDGIRVRAVDPFNPLVDREFLERSDNSIRCLSATQPAGVAPVRAPATAIGRRHGDPGPGAKVSFGRA